MLSSTLSPAFLILSPYEQTLHPCTGAERWERGQLLSLGAWWQVRTRVDSDVCCFKGGFVVARVPILELHLPWPPLKKKHVTERNQHTRHPLLDTSPALPFWPFGIRCRGLVDTSVCRSAKRWADIKGSEFISSTWRLNVWVKMFPDQRSSHVDLFIQMMFSFLIHPPFLKQTWKSWKQLCILWKMSSLSPRWSFSTSKMCEDMAIGFGQFFGHKTKLCTVSIANFWKTAVAWSHSISHVQTNIFVNRWYSKPFWNTTKHRSYSNLLSNGKFETWTSKNQIWW